MSEEDPSNSSPHSLLKFVCSEIQDSNNENKFSGSDANNGAQRRQRLLEKLKLADGSAPKLSSEKDYVDVGLKEYEEKNLLWVKTRFPVNITNTTNDCENVPGVVKMRITKKELSRSLFTKRKFEQERRRKLYMQDNEGMLEDEEDVGSDDEEEDEEAMESDDEVEDEEVANDEKVADRSADSKVEDVINKGSEYKMEELTYKEPEIINYEKSVSEAPLYALSTTEDNINEIAERAKCVDSKGHSLTLPDTLSQWFNETDDKVNGCGDVMNVIRKDLYKEMVGVNEGEDDDSGVLGFCSGSFLTQAREGKSVYEKGKINVDDDNADCIMRMKRVSEKIVSDEEYDDSEEKDDDDIEHDITTTEIDTTILDRVVIDDNSDDEKEEDDEDDEEEIEQDIDETSHFDDTTPHKIDDDSDDEMAVWRKMQIDRRNEWVDEEAELSGDDIGSDEDDEDREPNQYEIEEGDMDDVPEDDILRVDLHKQLMKQEEAKDHKDLVRLRERFLAEGDVSGVETNRSFRLKLREDNEDEDIKGINDEYKEDDDEIDDIINMDAIKRRTRMENGEEEGSNDNIEVNDSFSGVLQCTTSTSSKLTNRVKASLLHINSLSMIGKDNVLVKESSSGFFVTKGNIEKVEESVDNVSIKRKQSTHDDILHTKKMKLSSQPKSSVFTKFK